MRDVAGKVAFITGGASGIGLAMARSFSAAGMKVVIADIEKSALATARAEFEARNAEFLCVEVDVTDRDALAGAADAAEERFENVHLVCNNAGVVVTKPVDRLTYVDWDWVMGVNLDGVINGIQTFTSRMIAHGQGGHFVNTASVAGLIALPDLAIYTAGKFAVVGLSEVMRADLASHDIGVSVLCPAIVDTRIGESERNRPPSLASGEPATLTPREQAERDARMEEFRKGALDPGLVGDMVLHAVRENELYILTHPETEALVAARSEEMAGAFARWRAFRAQQNTSDSNIESGGGATN